MVNLVVIHDNIVDVFEIDFLLEPRNEFTVVGFPHGIDERHFLVADEIGVVAGPRCVESSSPWKVVSSQSTLPTQVTLSVIFLAIFKLFYSSIKNMSTKLVQTERKTKFI